MALIGSGSNAIQNHAADSSVSAGKMDTSLAAVVEQLGGVAWANGAPVRYAGNLDAANFVSPLSLPNSYKAEPRSAAAFTVYHGTYTVENSKTMTIGGAECVVSGLLDSVSFGPTLVGAGAGAFYGPYQIVVCVNGTEIAKSAVISDSYTDNVVSVQSRVAAGDIITLKSLGGAGAGTFAFHTAVSFVAHVVTDHV